MLKKYKNTFVRLNMLMIGALLIIVFAVTFFYMYNRSVDNMQNMMLQFIEPIEKNHFMQSKDEAPLPNNTQDHINTIPDDKIDARSDVFPRPLRENSTVSVFFYDITDKTVSVISENMIVDEDKLPYIAEKIKSEPPFGKIRSDKIYFFHHNVGSTMKTAIVSTSYITGSMIRLLLLLISAYAVTMLVIYFISRKLSSLAMIPLQRAFDMENQFVADTSHDLKTPVAVILANNSIIKSHPEAKISDMAEWISNIDTAANNMKNLINEMLTISELDSTKPQYVPECVDISNITEKAILQLEPVAYEKNIKLTSDIKENIAVKGNSSYIQRIVQSLIDNAVKYEPDGGSVFVKLSLQHTGAVFSVSNQGSFLSEKDLEKVFDRFYRSDRSRTESEGHGLGLAICKQMTELMGGTIQVESSKEKGTIFTVSFVKF